MKNVIPTLLSWGPLGVLILAVVDGAGLPNPAGVDYLLLLLSWSRPDLAYWSALLAVAGSLVGSFILYQLSRKGGEALLDKHTKTGRGARFRHWFQQYGLITIFVPAAMPMIPLPMKIFVICAGALKVRLGQFLGVILAARLVRYFGLALLGRSMGQDAFGWLRSHAQWFGLGALGLLLLLFAVVRVMDRMRIAAAHPAKSE